ncbi:MAG TPA: acetylglutamate kinase [Myxococcales bacterium]|nr:acetylglutamate kinase [Myxococcales bacterium]
MSNDDGQSTWRARALVEALPYVQQWANHVVVIKFGGAAMRSSELLDTVAQDLVLLRAVGVHVVLVHGGGPEVTALGKRLGIEPRFVDGLRVTDDITMRIAQMVQVGGISRDLLGAIARFGGRAVGLAGHDGGGWLRGKLREHVSQETGKRVDLGRVGDIASVDVSLVRIQIDSGLIPVISPIAVDDDMKALNVNADTVATAVATALNASRLLYLTDVDGIHGPDGLVSEVNVATLRTWIADGTVSGGMVPKTEACLSALDGGVDRVSIVAGIHPHATLIELLTDEGIGTLIHP